MLKQYFYDPDLDEKIPVDRDIHEHEITTTMVFESAEDRDLNLPYYPLSKAREVVMDFISCGNDGYEPGFTETREAAGKRVAFCNDIITRVLQARARMYADDISTALVVSEMKKLPAFADKVNDETAISLVKLLIADSVVKAAHDNCILANLGITATDMQLLIDGVRDNPWLYMNGDYVLFPCCKAGEATYVMGRVWHPTNNPPNLIEVELEEEVDGEIFHEVEEDKVLYTTQPKGIRVFKQAEEIASMNERRYALLEELKNERRLEDVPFDEMNWENARFVYDCEERDGHLYQKGKRLDNSRTPADYGDVSYVHQTADGYCEDSYFGTCYFKTGRSGVFVAVPYSI